jgi:CcmD family protein
MTMNRHLKVRFARVLLALTTVAMVLGSAAAQAQEYVKVDNVPREQLPASQFVAGAYGFIWIAILVYVFVVARRLAKTRGDIAELRARLERATGPAEHR